VARAHRTLGIDIGGTAIKLAIVWSDGRLARAESIPTEADAGPERALVRLLEGIRRLGADEGLETAEMRAVGLASAGIVDADRNIVLDAPNLRSWQEFPFAGRLGDALQVPAFLENDVNAMAFGEWHCGAGQRTRSLLCLTLGTGVGGGIVLDGRIYRGAHGGAGEVGHVTVQRDGPECTCGSTGCLERYVGARWIVERARGHLARDSRPSRLRDGSLEALSPRVVSEAAEAGDAIAAAVLEETGVWLGVGLASLANVLDPERIVVGGGIARAGNALFEPARRTLRARAMSVQRAVEVVPAALGNDAAVVGAALLALDRVQGR
jgi:glucokinase